MITFYDTFLCYPVAERQRIATEAGMSLPYILKHTYSHQGRPKFRFQNAVELDKASKGQLPFIQLTEGAVDWDYVRRALNRAHRRGELG